MFLLLLACSPQKQPAAALVDSGTDAAIEDTSANDACADTPTGAVQLPADDAPHDGEEVEWWYWTGHMQDEDDRWYGFEHVFFLITYGTNRMMMMHSALTDVEAGTFDYAYEVGTGNVDDVVDGFSMDMAGSSAEGGNGQDTLVGGPTSAPFTLDLDSRKAAVLQHHDGYTDYDFGGYTYYYSRPRMDISGTVEIGGESRAVTGDGWFDHQWGALNSAVQTGWDWFALQLDDDRELMLFVVRSDDEPTLVGGSLTDADCNTTEIPADQVQITVLDEWTSDESGCTYPMGWQIQAGDLNVEVIPVLEKQELVSSYISYWEGAATVSGSATGRAYIELTGYCGTGY